MAKKYIDSLFGEADFPHLNKPDSKFNPDSPLFKVGLKLTGVPALDYKAKVDLQANAAFEEYMAEGEGSKLTPGERKKWATYYPYKVVEDDDGNPTGEIIFEFKQNAIIRTADGKKDIKIALYDAANNEIDPAKTIIRGGSIIRVRHAFRTIVMKSQKLVGTRLDFSMVQVKTFAKGNSGGGFGAVDGDVLDQQDHENQTDPSAGTGTDSGDY